MEIKEILEMAVKASDSKRAENIIALDMKKVSILADYFVIASADSERQVGAIADAVLEAAKENNVPVLRAEGQKASEWILIDFGDVVVNIFQTDQRKYYNLEKLWSDADVVDVANWVEA
ncbi:ribosome silencing factor [Pediococcus argentinicus]|uniref:Ribosomal silencing factor RsfS n=1 Tax=Pediococcus argentinicus TaxID=480391 RepID=A0A0R2NHT8_9LACO|nr:ribosome silencing factor [Pediococcus argentinicus]KRO25365.1 hypothetical protein IV88_GL000202 [Pediococcus argentinicus]NKZ22283.1 ribosome silencing factor [Pediococcus argentinicus]GEP19352.1 ribosomal silencing factor RsfS [Pediococcus argentinicus]